MEIEKFSDLQINNIVKCKISNDNAVYKIIALDGYHYKVMLDGVRFKQWIEFDKIKPIKLDNVKMNFFGFKKGHSISNVLEYEEKKEYISTHSCREIEVELDGDSYSIVSSDEHPLPVGKPFIYVHEFQNICLSLFDIDLSIKVIQPEERKIFQ